MLDATERSEQVPPVRFGVIGAGRWGRRHIEAIRGTPNAILSGVVTASAESARRVEAELGVRAFSDYRDLLSEQGLELDVVDVVAPNSVHANIAIASLTAGHDVLLEKPMGLSVTECDAVLSAAAAARRALFIGHEYRLSPLWGRVKTEIEAGSIGDAMVVEIHLWRRSFRPGSGGWRHDEGRVGSWLLEQTVHFFDLARWYLSSHGDPTSVFARTYGRGGGSLKENVAAVVSFPGDAYAVITQTSAGAGHDQLAEVVGTRGSLRLTWSADNDQSNDAGVLLELVRDDVPTQIVVTAEASEEGDLRREIAAVVNSLRHGSAPFADGVDGRWAVRMCLAAEASARHGHVRTV